MITKKITSPQHLIIKHLVRLRKSKLYRTQEKCALLSGSKLIFEVASSTPIKRLFIDPDFPLPPHLNAKEVIHLDWSLFKKITGVVNPEHIAAEVPLPKESDLEGLSYLIALDDISDPGNLGTLMRTALALGWEGLFLTEECVDPLNEKTLRSSKGAPWRLPYKQGTREELKNLIENKKVVSFAADITGEPPSSLSPTPPLILILGNEAHGVHPDLKNISTIVSIPMCGRMESLNVAAAGAILMYTLYER